MKQIWPQLDTSSKLDIFNFQGENISDFLDIVPVDGLGHL